MAALLLLAPLALLLAPQAQADEDSLVWAIDQEGIQYTTPQKLVQAGHAVCMLMDNGSAQRGAIRVVQDNSSMITYEAGYFVGASIGALCPEYSYLIG